MPEYLPRITVVTPSYNQAQFLEQTILSVIGQEYPNLEYFLMDGGSNDGSFDIIKKYEKHFDYWQSEKDGGQTAAINAGFARSTGEILCWLNSDDMFMPGALLKIGKIFQSISEPTVIFGNCLHFYEKSAKARGSDVVSDHKAYKLELSDYVIQPSSFWAKSTFENVGILDETYNFGMDWEWFLRAKQKGVKFVPIPDYLSLYRIHDAHKSGSGSAKRDDEIVKLYRAYANEKIVKAFLKLNKYMTRYKSFRNIVYAANHYDNNFVTKLIHLLFFSYISFEEYKNITPR
jgi:glycosyltransferase involved in cell wall biosynthesis